MKAQLAFIKKDLGMAVKRNLSTQLGGICLKSQLFRTETEGLQNYKATLDYTGKSCLRQTNEHKELRCGSVAEHLPRTP